MTKFALLPMPPRSRMTRSRLARLGGECRSSVRQVEAWMSLVRPSAVDNFRVNARCARRVVDVAATLEAISTLAEILTHHGPLHQDEIAQHCRERGMDDPDSAIQWNLLEMDCPARQLVDDRWVWLPAVLAGRVFTHRVSADESTHEVLTVTPDLDPITTLFEHQQYQRLADGST